MRKFCLQDAAQFWGFFFWEDLEGNRTFFFFYSGCWKSCPGRQKTVTFKLIRLKLGEKVSQVWLSSMCENSCSKNAEGWNWKRSPLERVGMWYLPSAFPCLPENVISGVLVLCCSGDIWFMWQRQWKVWGLGSEVPRHSLGQLCCSLSTELKVCALCFGESVLL